MTDPMDIVPSLHSFKSLQLRFGILASCPTIATVFTFDKDTGRPLVVTPAEVDRLFLSRTEDAEAISRTRAVCSGVRTLTLRLPGPEPSGCWESKLMGGYPLIKGITGQS